MDNFALEVLQSRLRSLKPRISTVEERKELRIEIKNIAGLFNHTELYAGEILRHPREVKDMLDKFYEIFAMDKSRKPEWFPTLHFEDAFSHFGRSSNGDDEHRISFPFKLNADDIQFFTDNIVSWLVILAVSNSGAEVNGIFNHLMNEYIDCREALYLLVETLKALVTRKVRLGTSFWPKNQNSRNNLQKNLRSCLIKLNRVFKISVPSVTHHGLDFSDSVSLKRVEPSDERYTFYIEITCLALRGVQLIAQILGFFHALKVEDIAPITQNVLFKCSDRQLRISLPANRCLKQIATYWLQNLELGFLDLFDFFTGKYLNSWEEFQRDPRQSSGLGTMKNLQFFRQFSSATFLMKNGNLEWKKAHPYLFRYLISEIQFINEGNNYESYKNSENYVLFLEVLATYGDMIAHTGIIDEEINNLCVALVSCQGSAHSETTNKLAAKFIKHLVG